MKIVIVGAGEVGTHIADQLISDNKDVVIIEKSPEKAKYAAAHLDCMVINGEGTSLDILKEAGVKNADIFISATDSDEVNIVSCLVVAGEFEVPVKIARVRNVEYARTRGTHFKGIDYVVNPEIEAAREIATAVEQGATGNVMIFENTEIQLRDIFIDEDSWFLEKPLKEIKQSLKEEFIVAGVSRDENILIPSGDFIVEEGDHLFLVAAVSTFRRIMQKAGRKNRKLRRAIVVGGGNIGVHVSDFLLSKGRDVKIIERDYDRCKHLSELFPEALVIHGDISDEEVFDDEQLGNSDVIITTTQNEELNILAGVYAKSHGVPRAISLVNKINYINISASLGIDTTISPKTSSVNAIMKMVRRGNIRNVYSVFDGTAEAIEHVVSGQSEITGTPLKDLKLPADCVIVAVTRSRKNIIPDGNFVIAEGDSVIFFAKRASIKKLEELVS